MEMTPQIKKEDKEGTDRLSLKDTFICHEAVTLSLTLEVPTVININFLLTTSIHWQEKRL